ncbi:heat-inducible transcription repressor HrcA [Desulfarculus baarsii DSM 2075]|uniref:Heat-inducible transcription repressor HrcA n=1 Tax=Desulfarculus baarsii (strain ATCC 33931 / DSM 2075 / LMG 7858 / VKM B-1802 / 2st14) TaxID=644282 RepID=E1QIB2_DESB2|nr:heat-inducible transcriptional repressor HrcA [Desulfarculus baarsii]ADK85429.1 heat-inducible transcription repressor HrcA [Desulfarculus baarsii DSM 2075]
MTKELSDRSKLILAAVVANYIATAEPVGSRTISRQDYVDLSPATVRNVMADLEEMGLLEQPHVSAGRVPTNEGLRLYVDTILQVGELEDQAKLMIHRALDENQAYDLNGLLKTAGKALSDVNRLAAVVAAPNPDNDVFRQMEFVRLSESLILVVMVTRSGVVQNRVILSDEDVSQENLDKCTRYLNSLMGELTLSQVRKRVAKEMAKEKNRFDAVLGRALRLGQKALQGQGDGDLFIEGRTNLMEAPEFADVGRLRAIFQAFEEKSTLLRLLERALEARGVRIFIGSEGLLSGLDGLTAVTASYGGQDSPSGALAVIGPTRMDYSKVIATVDYTARLVSRIIDSRGD